MGLQIPPPPAFSQRPMLLAAALACAVNGAANGDWNDGASSAADMDIGCMAAVMVSPMVCKVEIVAFWTSSACMVVCNMFRFSDNQDSTAFKSLICLSISSIDKVGITMPGICFMPGKFMPGAFSHMFLKKSSVSDIILTPGMADGVDLDMTVSI